MIIRSRHNGIVLFFIRTHIMRSINHHSTAKELRIEGKGHNGERGRASKDGRSLSQMIHSRKRLRVAREHSILVVVADVVPTRLVLRLAARLAAGTLAPSSGPQGVDLGMLRPFNRRRRGRAAGNVAATRICNATKAMCARRLLIFF